MTEKDILGVQVSRNVKAIGKVSLVLLEESHTYIKSLERTLLDMGITRYENSNFNYLKDRKVILDRVGEADRELSSLIESFDIKLKRD